MVRLGLGFFVLAHGVEFHVRGPRRGGRSGLHLRKGCLYGFLATRLFVARLFVACFRGARGLATRLLLRLLLAV
ncbi:MAG TPA: hypothetical protein VLS49_14630 [Usitatibacter sp.]|nr:hypothetical protein [Usitatibacter sp.]